MNGIVTLKEMRDRARPVLIFAPTPDDPQLQIQLRTFEKHAPGLAERDITVVALPYRSPSPTPATMTDDEADAARRRFHVTPADFVVILIGKDGGEKLRSVKPISFEKLAETIDTMPMRQEEMRRQRPAGR